MNLSEKIHTCRKRAGKSQEELVAELGVSRQAVSKWETGEAEPEIRKLQQLARIFSVSTDWLLSEEEAGAEAKAQNPASAPQWIEHLPKTLGRLLRRYGWLAGVYFILGGLLMTLLGGAGYGISQAMVKNFQDSVDNMFGGIQDFPVIGGFGSSVDSMVQEMNVFNPVAGICVVIMVIGGLLILFGAILAIVLRKYGKEKP